MLIKLNVRYSLLAEEVEQNISNMEKQLSIDFDELQKQAVTDAAQNGVLVLTGGPGTGKTTTIDAIIRFFESQDLKYY